MIIRCKLASDEVNGWVISINVTGLLGISVPRISICVNW